MNIWQKNNFSYNIHNSIFYFLTHTTMSGIEGKMNFYKGANETPESAAEKEQETYNQLHWLEANIKANIYTDGKPNKENDIYKLRASNINFIGTQKKELSEKEYGNAEFDYMIKTLLIIQQNHNGAWEKYNQITQGNYQTDTIGTIFTNLINFMKNRWLDRPQGRSGEYTNADFLYMVALGQALVIRDKKWERTDYSANQVSEDFGDNILWFKSMTDFESTNFRPLTEILDIKDALNKLKTNIKENVDGKQTIEETVTNQKQITQWTKEEKKEVEPITVTGQDNKTVNTTEDTIITSPTGEKQIIWEREFPKKKEVYKNGTDTYLFTQEDLKKRWITENMKYVPTIYKTLNLDNELEYIEQSEDLKNMLIKPWFEQINAVINDMKAWITINDKKYEYSENNIKQAIESRKFIQKIKINDKVYEVKFNTRTKEMEKIEQSINPLGDKEYQKTEGKSGHLKEKFQIVPKGLTYQGVKWIEKKIIQTVKIGDRIVYTSN